MYRKTVCTQLQYCQYRRSKLGCAGIKFFYTTVDTYDARKGTLRLTGQTVLWLLGPWGTSEKAMSPTCWRDFHSYWTSHNIWDTFGTNSLIKRTVRERGRVRETERKGRRGLLCVWLQWEQERGTRILRKKKKLIWPFPVNANFQMDSIMPSQWQIHLNLELNFMADCVFKAETSDSTFACGWLK